MHNSEANKLALMKNSDEPLSGTRHTCYNHSVFPCFTQFHIIAVLGSMLYRWSLLMVLKASVNSMINLSCIFILWIKFCF